MGFDLRMPLLASWMLISSKKCILSLLFYSSFQVHYGLLSDKIWESISFDFTYSTLGESNSFFPPTKWFTKKNALEAITWLTFPCSLTLFGMLFLCFQVNYQRLFPLKCSIEGIFLLLSYTSSFSSSFHQPESWVIFHFSQLQHGIIHSLPILVPFAGPPII